VEEVTPLETIFDWKKIKWNDTNYHRKIAPSDI
jgi:hypothetical protein